MKYAIYEAYKKDFTHIICNMQYNMYGILRKSPKESMFEEFAGLLFDFFSTFFSPCPHVMASGRPQKLSQITMF